MHTHHVYVFDAKIHLVEQTYFSNYYLQNADGSVEFLLYASNGSQYSWLKEYVGKTITVEVAMCDWNNKGYRACVLAIVVDGVTIVNDEKKTGKQIKLINRIDESLIAGIKVTAGTTVTDVSVARQIEEMKETLLKGGIR